MMPESETKRARLLPWCAILVGPALLFGGDLVRGRVLFWGTPLLQFGPWRLHALELVRQGEVPLWNSLVGMGAPLLANYQSALLYPPNWVLALVGVAWGQTLLVALHLVLAGAGMVMLARRLGVGVLGQAIGAVAYSLSGYLAARSGFLSINAATAWLPWILLAVDALGSDDLDGGGASRRVQRMLCLAAVLALQWLSGHAQTAWYSLVVAAVWMIWRVGSPRRWRERAALLAAFTGACVMAALVSAAQLGPTLEYWVVSQRAGALGRDFAMSYSFWPWRLTGVLAPNLFGTPVRSDFWGYGNYWEDAIYVGVLPFLLAMGQGLAAARGRGSHTRPARLLLAVCLVSLLLALGMHTPIYPWLYDHIPSFASFQAPTRWMLLFVFGLSLLAAMGADGWSSPTGRALYWTRLGTAGAGAVGVFAWLGAMLLGDVQPTFVRALAEMSVALALAGALSLMQPAQRSLRWSALVCLIVVADLVVAGRGLNPMTERGVYASPPALRERFGDGGRVYLPDGLEQVVKFDDLLRFDSFAAAGDGMQARAAGLPNTLMLDGAPSANNFDPLVPGRYAAWMAALGESPRDQQDELLRLMGVGWRATGTSVSDLAYVAVEGAARWRLYPAAQTAGSAEEALALVFAPGFDPEVDLVVECDAPGADAAGGQGGTMGAVRESVSGEVSARVESPAGTWVVLSDTWYPGWKALIDGEEAPSCPADGLFRALWVPAGEHQVEWVYRPVSFWAGVGMSLAGLVLMGGLWFRCRRD